MTKTSTIETSIAKLRKNEYNIDFEIRFDALQNQTTEKSFTTDEFECNQVFHDSATDEYVFTIETFNQQKGVLVHNHKTYKHPISIEMIDKFKLPNKSKL